MGKRIRTRWLVGPSVAMALALGWFGMERAGPDGGPEAARAAVEQYAPASESAPAVVQDRDREIFRETMAFARDARLDTASIGESIARLGRTFLGTPYEPSTLDVPGPERLVVNLRVLDCVTFVENTLALARLARAGSDDFDTFTAELQRIRYRDGEIDGYASRLHYFSDWIADNERQGLVRDITRDLGGVRDSEPIDFMSTHREAYPQLADEANFRAIERAETELSRRTRHYIPQERIAEIAPRIHSGDIIAATSSQPGLDITHTGIAVWVDGELHLMHAPLVGEDVQISADPLAERIQRIEGQDGIIVARPV